MGERFRREALAGLESMWIQVSIYVPHRRLGRTWLG